MSMYCCGHKETMSIREPKAGEMVCVGKEQDWKILESKVILEVGLTNGVIDAVLIKNERFSTKVSKI